MHNNRVVSPIVIVAVVFGFMGVIYSLIGSLLVISPEDEEALLSGQIFVILGICFLIATVVLIAIYTNRKKQIGQLIERGRYLYCQIVDIIPDYSVRIGNRNPYILLCQYTDSNGVIHQFKSDRVRFAPDRSLIGQQVRVYYQDESFRLYHVQLEHLLPDVVEH